MISYAGCSFEKTPFKQKGNEILDTRNGNTWTRCPIGQEWNEKKGCLGEMRLMNLEEAKAYATSLQLGWRVPSIEELATLVDKRCKSPVVNERLFGKVQETGEGANFLSQTLYFEGDGTLRSLYYTIDFMQGDVDAHTKGFVGAVRLVR